MVLVRSLTALSALEKEKIQNLAKCAKVIRCRRGELLCREGEVRSTKYDRLDILMGGQARASCSATPQSSSGKPFSGPRDMGMLLAGSIINATSQLVEEPEPFTVVAESAEVQVLTVAHADLVRLTGLQIFDQLKQAVAALGGHRFEAQTVTSLPSAEIFASASRDAAATKETLPDESGGTGDQLDPFLHSPSTVRRKMQDAPPHWHREIKQGGLLTSDISRHHVPDPRSMECPKVHPYMAKFAKGHARDPNSHSRTKGLHKSTDDMWKASLLESRSGGFWDEGSARVLDSVIQTCDEWGLSNIMPMASQLHTREDINRGLNPWEPERLELRGRHAQLVEFAPINPMTIEMGVPNSVRRSARDIPKRELEASSLANTRESWPAFEQTLLPGASHQARQQATARVPAMSTSLRRVRPRPLPGVHEVSLSSASSVAKGKGTLEQNGVPRPVPLLMNSARQLKRLDHVEEIQGPRSARFPETLHVHSIDHFLERRGGQGRARSKDGQLA